MTELRQRMIRAMQLHDLQPRTQTSYLRWVAELAQHYSRTPDRITQTEVEDFVLHLIRERGYRSDSCRAATAALRFFFITTLGRDPREFVLPKFRTTSQLPEILSLQEIERLFDAVTFPKHRALLMTTYGGGLRVSEVVRLKLSDIQSDRMMIRVEQGKGRKDRYTLLSQRVLDELRAYWKQFRPSPWLFPGRCGPLGTRCAQHAYLHAVRRAGITRRGGIHALRHHADFRIMPTRGMQSRAFGGGGQLLSA